MAQDCARSCSGRTRSCRRGGRVSGRRSKGSFGSDRTAGYAIGEERTSPWLEAITGIREQSYPRLGSKPVPAPRTRSEVRDMSPSGFHRRDRLKHPEVWGQSVSHYHTPSRELMAHTHTRICSSFSSVRRVSLHLPMQDAYLSSLSSGRSSYFRMGSSAPFTFLPIFLLAQIL
eukprot:scaffold79988_cov63-Phaeocystis_antarctica.AAC.3